MKKIIFTAILFISVVSFSQTQQPSNLPTSNSPTRWDVLRATRDSFYMFFERDTFVAKYPTLVKHTDHKFYYSNGNGGYWSELAPATDLSNYIQKQTQNPIASLTAGANLELMASGANLPYVLNWSAGRLAATFSSQATNPITTIIVDGVIQSFLQPAAGASVIGTKAVSVVRNTNTTFTNTVTTTDAKTASASVSYNFFPKRYWLYSSTSTPTSSNIVATLGGGAELTTTKANGTFDVVVTGTTKYVSYAYPSSYGALSSIIISGLESIGAFTQTTVSVTNASGYTQNYYVYTSNNYFNNTTLSFNSVN